MSRSIMRDATSSATTAVKSFKKTNPLVMRKKLEIKDTYFRRNDPDRELLRFELAFDFEEYFIVAAGVILLLLLARAVSRWSRRREMRKAYKK